MGLISWLFGSDMSQVSETPDEDLREEDEKDDYTGLEFESREVTEVVSDSRTVRRTVELVHFDSGSLVVEYDDQNVTDSGEVELLSVTGMRNSQRVYGVFEPRYDNIVTTLGVGSVQHRETVGSYDVDISFEYENVFRFREVVNIDEIDDKFCRNDGIPRYKSYRTYDEEMVHPEIQSMSDNNMGRYHFQTLKVDGQMLFVYSNRDRMESFGQPMNVEIDPEGEFADCLDGAVSGVTDGNVRMITASGDLVLPEDELEGSVLVPSDGPLDEIEK